MIPKKAEIVHPGYAVELHRCGRFEGHLWEQLELPSHIRNQDAFLLNLCNTGPIRLASQATVVHDLAFCKNPSWFHPVFAAWYRFLIPKMAKNCAHLLTVSKFVKSDIVETFGIPENSVSVVGNKVDTNLLEAIPERPSDLPIEPHRFYLMVGSNDPRKNFELPANFIANELNKTVVMVGGSHRNFRQSDALDASNIVRLGHIPVGNLKWLYLNASALIAPSIYEGFGIPNLEAMALGCQVICSDIPVFREVCGNAAQFFKPFDTDCLATCIRNAETDLNGKAHRQSLGKAIFTSYQNVDRAKLISSILQL